MIKTSIIFQILCHYNGLYIDILLFVGFVFMLQHCASFTLILLIQANGCMAIFLFFSTKQSTSCWFISI